MKTSVGSGEERLQGRRKEEGGGMVTEGHTTNLEGAQDPNIWKYMVHLKFVYMLDF